MDKKFFLVAMVIFTLFAVIISCKKNEFKAAERTEVKDKALLKFALCNMAAAQPTVSLFYNNNKVSPGLALTTAYPYPGGGFNTGGASAGDYLAFEPGQSTFTYNVLLPGTNTVTTKFFETTQTLEANKRYTLFTADTANNIAAILTPDDISFDIDSGYSRIRFINLIPNSPALDFYLRDSLLSSNIAYKQYTDYFDIPATLVDSFAIRLSGTPAGPARTATAFYRLSTNTNKRIYTFVARGYLGVTTAPRIPNVSVVINK